MDLIRFIQKLDVSFTDEEKEACLPVIDTMSKLADLTWLEGIFAFAESELIGDDVFLATTASLMYDGLPRDEIMEHLQLMMLSDDKTGAEQLGRLLVMIGVYNLLNGIGPWQIKRILMAALGAGYMLGHDTEVRKAADDPAKVRDFLEARGEYRGYYLYPKEGAEFRTLMWKMNDNSFYRVFKELRVTTLALALKGIDEGGIRKKIYRNLSVNRRIWLIAATDLHFRKERGSGLIKESLIEIIKIIEKLDAEGMLYLERSPEEREKRERKIAYQKLEESLGKIMSEVEGLKTQLKEFT